MVESFVLLLKRLLPPPPCRAGSQSQGVGTFYSGFRCALCKLGHHFQIKGLTNKYLSRSQHISWLSSQQPVWLHEVSLPSEAAVGVRLSWACCSRCTEPRGISFFYYLRDLALQHILEGPGRLYPSVFIYNSRNGGLSTTGPSRHLGRLLFSLRRPGNCLLVLRTSIADLSPLVTKNNLRLVVREKS